MIEAIGQPDPVAQQLDFNLASFDLYNSLLFSLMNSTSLFGDSFLGSIPPTFQPTSAILLLGLAALAAFGLYCLAFLFLQNKSRSYASAFLEIFLDIPRPTVESLKDRARAFAAYCKVSSPALLRRFPKVRGNGSGV